MKATLSTQGHQFTVQENDTLILNQLPNTQEGQTITLNKILTLQDGTHLTIGQPHIPNAKVKALLIKNTRHHHKLTILKRKRRKGYQRKQGSRRNISILKIQSIET